MDILRERPFHITNSAVCIGKFDGLHCGHQLLVDSVTSDENRTKVLFTFSSIPGKTIFSVEEKEILAAKRGFDTYLECPFDDKLKHMSAGQFLEEILIQECGARVICVGEDFRFGFRRQGDAAFLEQHSREYGYELRVFSKKKMYGEVVSSTRIRKELGEGRLERANELLGHPYLIAGGVQHGNQMGRMIQMPTANLLPDSDKLLLPFGVYASRVEFEGQVYKGVTNIGVRPTVSNDGRAGVETYLMDFDQEIYGRWLCVYPMHFIREERKFESLEALRIQMEEDKRQACRFFEGQRESMI